jgi:hypothetical protein
MSRPLPKPATPETPLFVSAPGVFGVECDHPRYAETMRSLVGVSDEERAAWRAQKAERRRLSAMTLEQRFAEIDAQMAEMKR